MACIIGFVKGTSPCEAFGPVFLSPNFKIDKLDSAEKRLSNRKGSKERKVKIKILYKKPIKTKILSCLCDFCVLCGKSPFLQWSQAWLYTKSCVYFIQFSVAGCQKWNLKDVKPRIDIWHGEADVNVPIHAGAYLRDRLPNARAKFLPGKGHFFILERWEEILSVLVEQ